MRPSIVLLLLTGGLLGVSAAVATAIYFETKPYSEQVYLVRHATKQSIDQSRASEVAKDFGAKIATKSQLAAAQTAGANWCVSGWVAEDSSNPDSVKDAQYPMQALPIDPATGKEVFGCGSGYKVNTCNPPVCSVGVTLYGKKPRKNGFWDSRRSVPIMRYCHGA